VLNSPIKFSDDPAGIYRGAPRLNQHGDEIRSELDTDSDS
jgi:crotonobetainyl-CoA:carnitine CoA-transferase CaiB-like acyl-CoA transferase